MAVVTARLFSSLRLRNLNPINPNPKPLLLLRFFSSSDPPVSPATPSDSTPARSVAPSDSSPANSAAPPDPPPPSAPPSLRSRTPLQKQFETWIDRLKPGFTPSDVTAALRAQSDPDLALDIFRWTAHQRGYRHNAEVYGAILGITISGRRFAQAESLVDEVLSGACADPDLPLFNTIIRFCCSRRHLFSRAFDVFKRMQRIGGDRRCRPSIETYSMLLGALVRRFDRTTVVSHVYMHSLRSLVRQLKASGVIPDTFSMNQIIKAHSLCLEMDDAVRVFEEMPLYNCEPNEYTYGYLVKGLCEKGWVGKGMRFYREMKGKGLVPTASVYMAVANSLAMERRFEEAVEVVFDMIGNGTGRPDLLTYRTVLEGMCREGKEGEAMEVLEEAKKRGGVDEKMYDDLVAGLRWLSQDYR